MQPVPELVCQTNGGFWQSGLRQLGESNGWAGSPLGDAFWSHLMSISTVEGVGNMLLNEVQSPPHIRHSPSMVQGPTATGQQHALDDPKCP